MSVVVCSCYLINIIIDIVLIFLISINVIEFDEIKTSKKNPVAQCNLLNPLVIVIRLEYFLNFVSSCRSYQSIVSTVPPVSSSWSSLTGCLASSTSPCWPIIYTGAQVLLLAGENISTFCRQVSHAAFLLIF